VRCDEKKEKFREGEREEMNQKFRDQKCPLSIHTTYYNAHCGK